MNIFAKFIISATLLWLVSNSTFSSEGNGVSIEVLNCQIQIPNGYVLRWSNTGMLQGTYSGKDFKSNPPFQFFPSTSLASLGPMVKRVIQETDLGNFRHLQVDLGEGVVWDVISGESSFFAAWVSPNSPFLIQFETCAAGS